MGLELEQSKLIINDSVTLYLGVCVFGIGDAS